MRSWGDSGKGWKPQEADSKGWDPLEAADKGWTSDLWTGTGLRQA